MSDEIECKDCRAWYQKHDEDGDLASIYCDNCGSGYRERAEKAEEELAQAKEAFLAEHQACVDALGKLEDAEAELDKFRAYFDSMIADAKSKGFIEGNRVARWYAEPKIKNIKVWHGETIWNEDK